MDILLNEDNDVELDDRNGLATVTGNREVRQSIRKSVTSYFYEQIGSTSTVNAIQKIELRAQDVAENNQYIDNLKSVSATEVKTKDKAREKEGIKVQIVYDTNTAIFTI